MGVPYLRPHQAARHAVPAVRVAPHDRLVSSMVTIRDCHFDTRDCGHSPAYVLHVGGTTAGCGHCGETVYPAVQVIAEHDIRCDGDVVTWWSRAMQLQVHRCGEEVALDESIHAEDFAPLLV